MEIVICGTEPYVPRHQKERVKDEVIDVGSPSYSVIGGVFLWGC